MKAAAGKAARLTEENPALKDAEKAVRKAADKVSKDVTATAKTVRNTAKKAVKAATVEQSVVVEYAGRQISAAAVMAACEKDYADRYGKKAVKSVTVYIKPEENCAYYVINGEGSDDYRIELS